MKAIISYFPVLWLTIVLSIALALHRSQTNVDCDPTAFLAEQDFPANHLLRAGDLRISTGSDYCCSSYVGKYLGLDIRKGDRVEYRSLLTVPVIRKNPYRRILIEEALASAINAGDYVDVFLNINSAALCGHLAVLAVLTDQRQRFAVIDSGGDCEKALTTSSGARLALLKVSYVPGVSLPAVSSQSNSNTGQRTVSKAEQKGRLSKKGGSNGKGEPK